MYFTAYRAIVIDLNRAHFIYSALVYMAGVEYMQTELEAQTKQW